MAASKEKQGRVKSMSERATCQSTILEPQELGAALRETFTRDSPNQSVCVVDGYGLRVTVDGQHLVVADGFGQHRRTRRYARAIHGLARLVVIGATGFISLEAMRWCAGAGVSVVVLNPSDGSVLSTSGACSVDDARLRRSQALALGNESGQRIAKHLIAAKLEGQADVVAKHLHNEVSAKSIREMAQRIEQADSLEEVRQIEAISANVYWLAWESIEPTFVKRDLHKIPDNWQRFEGRRSAINPGTARSSTDVINSLLNYSYRLVEAEARLAILALGLDPGLGLLHADMRNRDGFVLDLMEACRPIADAHIARLVTNQVFQRRDFAEDARGVVRVLAPLSHRLTDAMPSYGATLAPIAEQVASMLGEASPYDMDVPSALSRSKHKAAARRRSGATDVAPVNAALPGANPGGVAPRAKRRQRPTASGTASLPHPVCTSCGDPVPSEPDRDRPRGRYCSACLATRRREIGGAMQRDSLKRAPVGQSSESQERRQSANRRQQLARLEWESANDSRDHDPDWFTVNVLPGLAGVSLITIARATGMSTSAASKIRAGVRLPHPRHWEALRALALAFPGYQPTQS